VYSPPALQLPADAQDTELTCAFPSLSAAMPGTMATGPHMPFTSLTTNACCEPTVKLPPALQLPADAHDSDQIIAPVPSAAMPGTRVAVPQLPFTSLTTNGCCTPEASL
jgi:hypothetical protein